MTTQPAEEAPEPRPSRSAGLSLVLLAGIAGWLSYASVRSLAVVEIGPVAGSAFPLILDMAVLASSQYYLSGARINRPQHGYKLLTRALIVATIAINAAAASDWRGILVHVIPPMVFAALVELRARQVLGDARAEQGRPDRIPLRLWLTSPMESVKLSLWAARGTSLSGPRAARERYLTARRALRIAIPGRGRARLARGMVRRQLRAGTLDPAALITATGLDAVPAETGPEAVLRVALRAALGAPESASPNASGVVSSTPASASRVRIPAAPAARQTASSSIVLPPVRRARPALPSASQGASDAEQQRAALDLDRTALADAGRPVSMRSLMRELHIGQARATELRAWLDQQQLRPAAVVIPAQPPTGLPLVTHANGHSAV